MKFADVRTYVKGVLSSSFTNKTTIDKLSESEDGTLLFDGAEIRGGSDGEYTVENLTINGMDEYSEDEICIGKWVDGKPLYRKVINTSDLEETVFNPQMTNYNTPTPYTVTTSSCLSGTGNSIPNYAAWHIFSNESPADTIEWCSGSGKITNEWVQIDLGENNKKRFVSFKMTSRNSAGSIATYPKSFEIQGSNNGEDYTPIYSITDASTTGTNVTTEYIITNPGYYRYYRLYVYTNNGDTGIIAISKLVFTENNLDIPSDKIVRSDNHNDYAIYEYTKTTDDEDSFTADMLPNITVSGSGSSGGSNNTYLDGETVIGTWVDGKPIYRNVSSLELGNIVPVLTGESSKVICNNSPYPGNAAWMVFDGNANSFYGSPDNPGVIYLGYRFDEPELITKYVIVSSDASHYPKDFKLQGSNDETTWDTLDEQVDFTDFNNSLEPYEFNANNSNYYKTYRLLVTKNGVNGTGAAINTLEFHSPSLKTKPEDADIIFRQDVLSNYQVYEYTKTTD